MNTKLIAIGVVAALLPGAAMAQPRDPNCVASNQTSRAEGTILGAGAGALIGSQLAGRGSRGEGAAFGALGGAVAGNAIAGSRNTPCPPGYYYGPGPGGPPPGAYAGYPPGAYAGYGAPAAGFWRGAPVDIRSRIGFLQQRINRMSASGRLSPPESRRAYDDLQSIQGYIRDNRWDYGRLTPDQQGYVQARLDHLAASIHWMAQTGY